MTTAGQQETFNRADGLLAYDGSVVPVLFADKAHLNGWYRVSGPKVDHLTWFDVSTARWDTDLERVGGASEVEWESRLIGGNRTHASSATPELWHAAPVGHDGYYVGASTPGYVDRTGADGVVRAYRAIPAATNPRWSVDPIDYYRGAAAVTVNGYLRTGLTCPDTPAAWAVSNGLLKVEPRTSTGTLLVTSWLTTGWGTPKAFDVKRGTTSLGAAQHVTLLRNDPCEVRLRLTWDHAPGRTTLDVSLKRGARFAGLYAQQYAAPSPLRVDDNGGGGTVTNQLTASGYIASTTSDADGNRWVIGTTLASAAAGTFGLAASVTATGLPAYVGCVVGGASPASGDSAVDVNAQYLGAPDETERAIAR